ncbi:MAG: FIG00003370: Multicopper polyphenol oxidase [uncultured Thermomicrobiales bacterium]|uniref:Purine nucleoside phosphorylase n=1 Tax=uncultured Thermomicrobiales bacterium TaxID=1645740 RepID=A0A6J4TM24_9BACT|nr:MAG: FIG00003370: Multicopper polyphenol oxidase [uncultured Thermomicrobiales bacterium]
MTETSGVMVLDPAFPTPRDGSAPEPHCQGPPRPLKSALLDAVPGVVHGITGRVPGLGAADGNVAYSAPRDRQDAWLMRQRWCAALGLDAARLAVLGQIHGAAVRKVGADDAGSGARPATDPAGYGDALISDEPGVVLMTLHADCLPLLLVDPDRPAVAAVHAGWRGTVADIAGATVAGMRRAFGSDPARLLGYIGPTIGPDCYEVGPEVAEAWLAVAPDGQASLRDTGSRPSFDLRRANRHLLAAAGLEPARIEVSSICTRHDGDAWFSHRGQGPATGRFGAIIALADRDGD